MDSLGSNLTPTANYVVEQMPLLPASSEEEMAVSVPGLYRPVVRMKSPDAGKVFNMARAQQGE